MPTADGLSQYTEVRTTPAAGRTRSTKRSQHAVHHRVTCLKLGHFDEFIRLVPLTIHRAGAADDRRNSKPVEISRLGAEGDLRGWGTSSPIPDESDNLVILRDVETPIAKPSIMQGINQTILFCLSAVVIASLIGAKGLGYDVLVALQYAAKGQGVLAGLAILVCAMVIDRIVQGSFRK